MTPLSDTNGQPQDGGMKLALFIVVVFVACANELVLGVKKEQDEAMSAASLAPQTLRETLADLLAPVLALLYIVALPVAFIALLCMLFVFAPALALALALMLLIPAARRRGVRQASQVPQRESAGDRPASRCATHRAP